MNQKELCNVLKLAGIKPIQCRTGHPDWTRVFFEYKGVRYARASIEKDVLYNIKWYADFTDSREITETMYVQARFMSGSNFTEAKWDAACKEALEAQAVDLEVRQAARKELPPKKRKAIKPRRILNFLSLEIK